MLKDRLRKDQTDALKSGYKPKLDFLRYILAQIQNKEIEKRSELNDEEIISVLKKISNQLKESISASKQGGRKDLTDHYQKQYEIVREYLPEEI